VVSFRTSIFFSLGAVGRVVRVGATKATPLPAYFSTTFLKNFAVL
jgi:hypothetical protein